MFGHEISWDNHGVCISELANEDQLKQSHEKFILELAQLCQAGDGSNRSHAIALVKGLRSVLEQIQVANFFLFLSIFLFSITVEVAIF